MVTTIISSLALHPLQLEGKPLQEIVSHDPDWVSMFLCDWLLGYWWAETLAVALHSGSPFRSKSAPEYRSRQTGVQTTKACSEIKHSAVHGTANGSMESMCSLQ